MKSLMLLATIALAASSAMAQDTCRGRQLEGRWVNPHDETFEISYETCDRIVIRTEKSGETHMIDISGREQTTFELGELTWKLKIDTVERRPYDYFLETGTLMWRIIGGMEGSPELGLDLGVGAFTDYVQPGVGQIVALRPYILRFKYRTGELSNLFDKGLNLAVRLLNRFNVGLVLSEGFGQDNTLARVGSSRDPRRERYRR
ncbi:MAG TPA: hypothetical protein VM598_06260 [Bdellovibrionota bacterium]|nr:hypothetical protein [Bdellovibrionota bacterium]